MIDVQRNGNVEIRLDIGLKIREVDHDKVPAPDGKPRSSGKAKLRSASPDCWLPVGPRDPEPLAIVLGSKRNQFTNFRRLQEAASTVTVGDLALVDQLLVPAAAPGYADASRNRVRGQAAIDNKRRLLVVAPMASYTAERAERAKRELTIAGFHGMPRVFLAEGQRDRIAKRFRWWYQDGQQVVRPS